MLAPSIQMRGAKSKDVGYMRGLLLLDYLRFVHSIIFALFRSMKTDALVWLRISKVFDRSTY
jgi:hypothetical protein